MVNFNGRAQVPHFTYWNHNTKVNGMEWWWCPSEQTSISYLSNDAAALKQRIANYKMHDGTGSGIAMNWGLMLLEPSAQPLVQQGAAVGLIPAAFSDRPAPFNDGETLKFIVLMTDGAISEQWRPTDYFYPPEKAPVKPPSSPVSHPQTESTATTLSRMNSVCKRAKDNGVVVFTIGFEAGATAAKQMRACASSDSHFYDVKGLDINTAFQSIASAIQKIRLTQ